ncbi:epoxide hydrolase family protein [Naasia aerilata]|uniref:Microsomal epoxide hydrolase n=1 Tax=Naasia aerilata TaxID=1162966 RepID=A0ABN6XP41_9MICO|nr:epoxide hydrolase family protein [Naasia aerilata]BDZ46736.1 microsomal epoxide hydrolase [Naasia aerilata]
MEQSAPDPVSIEAVEDLRDRLRRARFYEGPVRGGWDWGVDRDYLRSLVRYWEQDYDWSAAEARIRALPWVKAGREHPLRVIHQTASDSDPVVLLLHGWPDSVLRFERVLPLLEDVNVVVPALPGFPFAVPYPGGGASSIEMAAVVAEAMDDLGYRRYVVSAGDVGCDVAEALAALRPEAVAALHLTDLSQYHFLVDLPADLSPAESEYVEMGRGWQAREGGYMHEQSTRPWTVAAGLQDSPVGLAAWLLEKLRAWTDNAGDVESVFSRDDLLTWISAYWFSGCIGTSFFPYAAAGGKPWPRIEAPSVFTIFPKDLVNAPREFVERFFRVVSWTEPDRGGHFAAWEDPEPYIAGVRTALAAAV